MIVAIVGGSGSGKTYLVELLKKRYLDKIKVGISDTTRAEREGEIDGVHYHFISKETFDEKVKNHQYIETVEFVGNFYGFSKDEFEEHKQKPIIVVIEPNGLEQIIKEFGTEQVEVVLLNTPRHIRLERMQAERGVKAAEERIDDGIVETFRQKCILSNSLFVTKDNLEAFCWINSLIGRL